MRVALLVLAALLSPRSLWAKSQVEADGALDCPSVHEIESRLQSRSTPRGDAPPVFVRSLGAGGLELTFGSGLQAVKRRLPPLASCSAEAEVAAVVIGLEAAGWLRPFDALADDQGVAIRAGLPRFEMIFALGLDVNTGPARR